MVEGAAADIVRREEEDWYTRATELWACRQPKEAGLEGAEAVIRNLVGGASSDEEEEQEEPSGRREDAASAAEVVSAKPAQGKAWVVDDTWDVDGFAGEIPQPALTFDFELDPFQKRAVRRVERQEHVLVSAHTSAGKTVVAEYAIAKALQQGMRAIYTSPIKALSNQKFREFTQRFEKTGLGSVGIVTGDVAVNPEAGCVIMTTEILRSMLYRGDKGLNSVRWVIFDEVHYVNDADRGVVWEEVIILLPAEVSLVMLSATVPNYKEFAGWVGRTKRRPVYTVHTSERPTPLRHLLHFQGRTLPLMDADRFHAGSFKEINDAQKEKFKPKPRAAKQQALTFEKRPFGMTPAKREEPGYLVEKVNGNDPSKPAWTLGVRPGWSLVTVGDADVRAMPLDEIQTLTKEAILPLATVFEIPPKEEKERERPKASAQSQTRDQRERAETQRLQALLREMEAENRLPATVFVFSRRRVESLATDMSRLDLCSHTEKSKIHVFLQQSFERLSEADRFLPQVCRMQELAARGIGIHHGGLLPLVKEAVEIMFARGLVKVLFATETFAMGVNMPARSVVFAAWKKHDGVCLRSLLPSEYTQMAGRAGRRGLDAEGYVYLLCGEEPPDQKEMTRILTHQAERLNSRFRVTFAMILQLQRFSKSGVRVEDVLGRSFMENARAQRRPLVRRDLVRKIEELDSLPEVPVDIEEYAALEMRARAAGVQLHEQLYKSRSRDKIFCIGRLVRTFKEGAFASVRGILLGPADGQDRLFKVAVLLAEAGDSESSVSSWLNSSSASLPRVHLQEGGALSVTTVQLGEIMQLFEQCIDTQLCRLAEDEHEQASFGNALLSFINSLATSGGLQPLVLGKTLKQVEVECYDMLQQQRELQLRQEASPFHHAPRRFELLDQAAQRHAVVAQIQELEHELGAESLGLLPELHARQKALQILGCNDHELLITLKGHAAVEVLSGDELTIVEIVFCNVFEGCTAAEVAAAISAFVFPDKVDEEAEMEKLPKRLAKIRSDMLEHHRRVERLLREHEIDIDPGEFQRTCNVGLMGVAYRWACGENLADIMPDTWLQEGTIVRAIVRTEELLRKLQDVAKLLGNTVLRQTFKEASELVHRDIPFVPSLYIE